MRALLALIVLLAFAAPAHASRDLESTFQDDNHLIYTTKARMERTLDRLKGIGVDRVRVTVLWRFVAPSPTQRERPTFDATDPRQYPEDIWKQFDDLVRAAQARGIGVNLNVTGPSPTWANKVPPRPDIEDNYEPDPLEFGRFVRAVATRYSGTFSPKVGEPALPRVSYWSIWNEPNHSGWLTPQWRPIGKDKWVERASGLYRELLDWAFAALLVTGHGPDQDTILIGETAPSGNESRSYKRYMTFARFIRTLYCVDKRFRRETGKRAKRLGCPASGPRSDFVEAHPALFTASGYAHHPYNLLLPPSVKPRRDDYANIATLGRVTRTLDRIFRTYGVNRRYRLYLTEYGYQTKPDPIAGAFVSFKEQARWINQSEYMAWKHPRSKTLAQFLLYDDGEPLNLTFQSGLVSRTGKAKPSYRAYRLPVWVVRRRGSKTTLWGRLRPAADGLPAAAVIQRRRRGTKKWRPVKNIRTKDPRNFFVRRVRARRGDHLRVVYGGHESRAARVR